MASRTITVKGVDYTFDAADITNDEGMAIEKAVGTTFDQWNENLAAGSMLAMTALVWLLQRRDNPGLKIQDVHFKVGDLAFKGGEDDADASGASTEVVPGGTRAEFDPADPTPAPSPSTDGASETSPDSTTSSESSPGSTTV